METIILLHGAIGSKEQLIPLADLLKNEWELHTLNFSGHGGEPINKSFSITLFADNVIKYMQANNIKKAHFFGYSMGGYVALYLAKHFPEKVITVFTLATKFEWTLEIATKEIGMLNAEKIAIKLPSFAKELEKRHSPTNWKEVLLRTAEMMQQLGIKNVLTLSDFESIKQPIFISIGDNDMMVSLDETIAVYKKLPNANFMVFPYTQHPIERIDLAKLSEAINSFVKKHF
jgi:esterase/lipase